MKAGITVIDADGHVQDTPSAYRQSLAPPYNTRSDWGDLSRRWPRLLPRSPPRPHGRDDAPGESVRTTGDRPRRAVVDRRVEWLPETRARDREAMAPAATQLATQTRRRRPMVPR